MAALLTQFNDSDPNSSDHHMSVKQPYFPQFPETNRHCCAAKHSRAEDAVSQMGRSRPNRRGPLSTDDRYSPNSEHQVNERAARASPHFDRSIIQLCRGRGQNEAPSARRRAFAHHWRTCCRGSRAFPCSLFIDAGSDVYR